MFMRCYMLIQAAIECHLEALQRIVAALLASVGMVQGQMIERLSPRIYRSTLRVLRPAEAAVRRMIVVLAQRLVAAPEVVRARSVVPGVPRALGNRRAGRTLFRLFDPLYRAGKVKGRAISQLPRMRVIEFDLRVPMLSQPAVPPSKLAHAVPRTFNTAPLRRRLLAIELALRDMPRQAMRYARWRARPADQRWPKRVSALRSGAPPGLPIKPRHEVHEILRDCHWLACNFSVDMPVHQAAPDTS
jgi:hypothetical protein